MQYISKNLLKTKFLFAEVIILMFVYFIRIVIRFQVISNLYFITITITKHQVRFITTAIITAITTISIIVAIIIIIVITTIIKAIILDSKNHSKTIINIRPILHLLVTIIKLSHHYLVCSKQLEITDFINLVLTDHDRNGFHCIHCYHLVCYYYSNLFIKAIYEPGYETFYCTLYLIMFILYPI